ncbi:universal stress protein [Sedimentibacter sp. MB31-C6]|uniref:universal stress protein n=1 Tax=Sedimentibacter sp. MB31-C6 TaxID=3109366 RepID=UPI002DDCF615|nr:universal stress protein [Sedimentibacter sp. MB36-C1]WSI05234.1 universal stress protein [Sedimentibacter sp. MB36-C1]
MKKILVPIDGSTASIKAAEKAIELAKLFNSYVTFVTVVNLPSEDKYSYFGLNVQTAFESNRKVMLKELINEETKMLNIIVNDLDVSNLNIEKKVIVGIAYKEILKLSNNEKFDLIIMGRRGFSNIERFFVGSVTQRVLSEASCPVLVVND